MQQAFEHIPAHGNSLDWMAKIMNQLQEPWLVFYLHPMPALTKQMKLSAGNDPGRHETAIRRDDGVLSAMQDESRRLDLGQRTFGKAFDHGDSVRRPGNQLSQCRLSTRPGTGLDRKSTRLNSSH